MNDSSDEGDSPPSSSTSKPYTIQRRQGVRNVAIVAHVDHGKTTLVDELLKVAASSTSSFNNIANDEGNNADGTDGEEGGGDLNRLMDSGELEKERGITITSKVTRLDYYSAGSDREHMIINVVGT